jgi:hypothetical protein
MQLGNIWPAAQNMQPHVTLKKIRKSGVAQWSEIVAQFKKQVTTLKAMLTNSVSFSRRQKPFRKPSSIHATYRYTHIENERGVRRNTT